MNRPILGITMGDPAGCGPEITVRALSDAAVYQRCRPLVIGDIKCIRDALRVTNHSELKLHQVDRPSQGLYEFGTIDVLHLELVDWDRFSYPTIAKKLGISVNTVAKYVAALEEHGLIRTEHTEIITKDGHKRNGCLRYTILPIKNALDLCYKRQLEKAEQALERQRTQANAERLGIQFVPADDERSA